MAAAAAMANMPRNMHRITGTFADPSHESAFAAQLFRMAYPTHTLLMALLLAYFTWTYWAVLVLCVAVPGLACRVLLHRKHDRVLLHQKHDPVQSQWMGSWAWIVLTTLSNAVDMVNYMVAPAATCLPVLQAKYMAPFAFLLCILINGTHGLGFACKFVLMTIFWTDCVVGIATCHDPELDPWFICAMGIIVLSSAATHTAELYLRRSYAEKVQAKVQEQQSRTEEATRGSQLEERMEQLQTSNERLLYDVQRRGRPLDDDDDDRRRSRRPSLIRLAAHAAARSPVQRIQRHARGGAGAGGIFAEFDRL